MFPVNQIQNGAIAGLTNVAGSTPGANVAKGDDFGHMLMDVLKQVDASQQNSAATQNAFMTGQPAVEYHDLMIAMEKANIAMQLTMAVRNKVLDAYSEIDRMQV